MSRKPTLRHRLEYGLFWAADRGLRLLPWSVAWNLGRGLGRLVRLLDGRHRRVVRENLRQSDLGLSEQEITRLSKECFAHFGSVLMTTVHLLHMDADELKRRVSFDGLEHWDAARTLGRGFIGLTGHYGNWEAMALALSAQGRPLSVIGRELDNPLLEPKLRALRSRFGNQVVPKDGAARDTIKLLRKGEGVGFLLDQDALTAGLFVRFLGRWASTFSTPALLAIKYDIPVIPIFSWPNSDGTVSVKIHPPLDLPKTGDGARDVWVATQLMTRCLDARIRENPRWWFWMHRRFKTRPGEGNPLPAPLPPPEWVQSLPNPVTRG